MIGYYKRLLLRTWAETRSVWTIQRFWIGFAPTVAIILLLNARNGWKGFQHPQDLIENSIAGVFLGFAGSIIINLILSPKRLDTDRLTKIAELETANRELAAHEAPRRTKQQEANYQDAKAHLATWDHDRRRVLKEIMMRGKLIGGRINDIPGVSQDRVHQILNDPNQLAPLVTCEDFNDPAIGLRRSWFITLGYQTALNEILYEQEI